MGFILTALTTSEVVKITCKYAHKLYLKIANLVISQQWNDSFNPGLDSCRKIESNYTIDGMMKGIFALNWHDCTLQKTRSPKSLYSKCCSFINFTFSIMHTLDKRAFLQSYLTVTAVVLSAVLAIMFYADRHTIQGWATHAISLLWQTDSSITSPALNSPHLFFFLH